MEFAVAPHSVALGALVRQRILMSLQIDRWSLFPSCDGNGMSPVREAGSPRSNWHSIQMFFLSAARGLFRFICFHKHRILWNNRAGVARSRIVSSIGFPRRHSRGKQAIKSRQRIPITKWIKSAASKAHKSSGPPAFCPLHRPRMTDDELRRGHEFSGELYLTHELLSFW